MPDTSLPPCHGLLWARRLDRPEILDEAAVTAILSRGVPPMELWLHFDLRDLRAHRFLQALPGLPPQARAALDERAEMAHLDTEGRALWGTLPDFHYEALETPDPLQMGILHVALAPGLLVTARRHPLRAPQLAGEEHVSAETAAQQWDIMLRAILDGIARAAAALSQRLDGIEDRLLQDRPVGRTELARARRDVLLLHRRVEPAAGIYEEIAEAAPAWLAPAGHDAERAAARFASALRTIASLRERGRIAQDDLAARTAEGTNQRLMVLSVLTAILLPPTLVTGFFGMNTTDLPGTSDPGGSWWAIAAMLGAALLAVLVLTGLGFIRLRRGGARR
ncbi:CorA family divalent cation transporter [Pararoseomonas sp. SCSIO 73927]|uniref:CorA family divalent cation transporter n=1 Tax=Pararoseomonas sp. SCSIO 73927 TaxID=3114537 RepID=UPI0030CDA529